ncbi:MULTISPECIES: peptidoglycan DD-metalloendopeptidase family protein [unclassified Streptomyces]|uniref:peptidoglycan DD-metalloendopeptidase family protein n=1 Tax=unclassified Streptomyces TaxID=2593676 RepID=UPI002948BA94|nr:MULTISPECIES: peptidoglycan DD-metalloendopeptidase family protein [unclassified Streptomyces]
MSPTFPRRALYALLALAAVLAPSLVTVAPADARPVAEAAGFAASCPAGGPVSQGHSQQHNGIDIANDYGTPIFAVGDGEVTVSGTEPGYGQWIRILHRDDTLTEYGHMYRRDVAVGDHVTAGQRIALMGSEGQSSGPHLHLRVWGDAGASVRTDPIPYLAARGVSMPCVPGSDPLPAPLIHPSESGRVVSARSADGRLEVFAAGADGVHHAWQTEVNGAWSEWEPLGGPGGAQLAVGPNADGRLEVFALDGDVFRHRYQLAPSGAWSGWEDFGGGGRDIAVGANGDGRLEVFASGPVGVFHRYQTAPNGGWSGWEPTGGGPVGGVVEMEKAPDGRLEVFAMNGSTFQHQYQTSPGGGWSAWEDFGGGGRDLTVDHNLDGRLEVFASGPAGVFHKYQTNPTSWSGWEATGGPADSQVTSHPTADGRVEVFAVNGAAAQHLWQTGVNAPYGSWEPFGTGGTEITATANADGRMEVFGASRAGVYHKWQTGFSRWSDWYWLNSTPGPALD